MEKFRDKTDNRVFTACTSSKKAASIKLLQIRHLAFISWSVERPLVTVVIVVDVINVCFVILY